MEDNDNDLTRGKTTVAAAAAAINGRWTIKWTTSETDARAIHVFQCKSEWS